MTMEKNSISFNFDKGKTLTYEMQGEISGDEAFNALAILAVKCAKESGRSVKEVMEFCLTEYVPNAMLQLMIVPEVIEDV